MDQHATGDFDPVTIGTLWSRLVGLCDEAATALVRTSFSPVVQDCNDFCCALMDADGRSLAENTIGIPAFIGTVARTTRAMLAVRPAAAWAPGDVLMTNDPWLGTGHLLDFTLVSPIFAAERLVGFAGTVAHAVDVGGVSWASHARSVYEEGIRFPVLPLLRAGALNEDVVAILSANVRQPALVRGDLEAQLAACRTIERRTLELMEDAGLGDLGALARELHARTERAMRAAIGRVPDGTYRSEVAVDGRDRPLALRCRVTVAGEALAVDFDGTSDQVDFGINAPLTYTQAYTAYPLKCALDPETPKNEGSYLPIRVTAPAGSLLNPTFPAPVSGRHLTGMFCAAAVYQALAEACPALIAADSSGPPTRPVLMARDREGDPSSLIVFAWGGTGARRDADGLACTAFPGNDNCAPVEIMERAAPVRFLRKEVICDSGGAGRRRGGLGQDITFEYRGTTVAALNVMSARHQAPPRGLAGGGAGTPAEVLLNGRPMAVNAAVVVQPGDIVTLRYPGGGGFGPPREREPALVQRDVADGYVSAGAAEAVYGCDLAVRAAAPTPA